VQSGAKQEKGKDHPILTQLANQDVEMARKLIKDFAREARSNPAMVEQLKSNPERTLTAAGVPAFAMGDVLREEGMKADVNNLAAAGCWVTCACSDCCVSL
jgi:hypothetical protein